MSSAQLYDPGEETWPLKVHAACGGIYLRGYLNLDITGEFATANPVQAQANETDIGDYYAGLDDTPALRRPTIVDRRGNMECLRFERGSVHKLVCLQALEHLSPLRVLQTLRDWHALVVPHGVLVLSVPDMDGTLESLERNERTEFMVRHLRGSRRDEFNLHRSWWTRSTLAEVLTACGYGVEWLENCHVYPALVLRARKS